MKFEIFGEGKDEQVLRLKLEKRDDGVVMVTAVDKNGERLFAGDLVEFKDNGTIRRPRYVSKELGLQLTENDKIKEVE